MGGLRVTGGKSLVRNLEITGKQYSSEARDLVEEGAFKIQETAQDMVPELESNLRESIVVEYDKGGMDGRRKRFIVGIDEGATGTGSSGDYQKTVGDYAWKIHEGIGWTNLGAKSLAKNAGERVGTRFLARASNKWAKKIERAVATSLKKVSKKAARRARRK
tara:strand:- start:54 stop:539 length:486 start_codon:yes stop_codon:yes gene_type:complete